MRELAAADVLAAPAIDAATGDYAGWISCGGLVAQILRQLYPALTDPTLFAQDDVEAAVEDAADDQDANAMCFREAFDVAASRASAEARGLWSKLARVGDDGDTCYVGFADTTLLDFVSRGLDVRAADRKRIGDFEPCHRIGVFAEREDARAACEDQKNVKAGGVYAKAEGAAVGGGGDGDDDGDDDDDDDDSLDITLADMRPKWIAVVAQLDVVDLMVANEDQLGTYPHATTMRTLGFANATVGDQTLGRFRRYVGFPRRRMPRDHAQRRGQRRRRARRGEAIPGRFRCPRRTFDASSTRTISRERSRRQRWNS